MKKRLIYMIVSIAVMSVCMTAACAAENTVPEWTDTILSEAGYASAPAGFDIWGDTAACLAEKDGARHLIIMENQDGRWQIVIDNPTALIRDREWPQLLLDTDNAVFWTYRLSDTEIVRYHSTRNADGTWGPVDQYYADSSFGKYTHVWSTLWDDAHGGEIIRSFSIVDENDNDSNGIQTMQILPAEWMADCVRLADFDVSRFPTMFVKSNDHFAYENERFFREAAAAVMPEYTFIKGMLKNDAMHFLMQKPNGDRIYVICEYASHRQVDLIESTPLPAGTVLGYENFADSLWIDGRCVTVQLLYSGKAGLEYIYDNAYSEETGGFLFFGDRTVWDGSEVPTRIILFGDHPWGDITRIDWSSLPRSLDEASARMDSGDYAMVVNPNPADRLNLREQADKESRSQGKYYTGTPVGVSAQDGDWTLVVFGDWQCWRRGYMMKRYLAFGQSGSALRLDTSAMPQLTAKSETLKVYKEPQIGDYIWHMNADPNTMKVIGIIGSEWYHVWFPATGEYGFVRQSDLTAGNG